MIGKIRQKLISQVIPAMQKPVEIICPICDRSIPPSQRDAHHLIPKSKGGKTTEYLHRICHKQIHALFTEVELAQQYHHAQMLRDHPEMKKFIQWVASKPDSFYEKTRKSSRLKSSK
ncbi:HNH endonuclease [Polynucleobacter sp. AP-Capit-er-40B-B4]|uniref:HNH endonuclease n=1 Tax=Polynucleobacter sp. AP-Capit-er-40B-B4 TaxID=2576927 RepID=UPI001C0CACCE|nr:HNH endonuclease signature motif containing protein [Polynucleobacter sp. AP-Capit-er-40B-B4]MBU3581498.1 HNH endonuclease [Polynucleobacter sp. AP-Capit-er-40B-B4]